MNDERRVVSVSEITRQIKQSLETQYPRVWVEGEISNCKLHSSGHLYFSLKDEGSQISATMWRNRVQRLLFEPADGMKVIARGSITVYPPRGSYQIDVEQIQPKGVGELQLAFERLKRRLAEEGLFDEERKKPLPEYPERIGIVTSASGAALQDIRKVLERRMPSVEAILLPVRVQGPGAAGEIAEAIRAFNDYGDVDVLIVGRGGGSLEDLWAFNEEVVARAIASSRIPVVSAVGHEVDFTIADFVADRRASTPSAAAELVVRSRLELLEVLGNMCYTMQRGVETRLKEVVDSIAERMLSYSFRRPGEMVRESMQRVDECERDLSVRLGFVSRRSHDSHRSLSRRLQALNPSSVLKRGYSIVRKGENVISTSRGWQAGERATIQFHDGTLSTRVAAEEDQT